MSREEITKLQSDATTPEDKTKYTDLLTKYDEIDSKVTNAVKERISKYRTEREAFHRESILAGDPTLTVLKSNFPEFFQ